MTYEQYYELVRTNYRPLHQHLYTLREDFFVPQLVRAVRDGSAVVLREVYREPHPEIYVFDLLRPEFCGELLEEVAWFERWSRDSSLPMIRPNTMNNYGAVLDSFGFAPCLQEMMEKYVSPFSSHLYPDVGGDSLDSHHGFTVEYKVGKDVDLDFHVDQSDVTLNVCLGTKFSGGALYFRGIRCALCQQTASQPEEEFEIEHTPGQAILHRGKHRHGADPITDGERSNLILWCMSSRFAQNQDATRCPIWCHGPKES